MTAVLRMRFKGGDVYFDVRAFKDYGKLSGQSIDKMHEAVRIEKDSSKKDPLDFVLWKASKPGEPVWDSPWGPGRPGWHIECSCMSMKHLHTADPGHSCRRQGLDFSAS